MRRALAIIAAVGIIGLLSLLAYNMTRAEVEEPRFVDRLPMAEIIGRTDILNLAKDFSPATYNNQISFREFVSPEFILSQGKTNGLNLQLPVYFFGNHSNAEIEDWGVMLHVSDSSKLFPGITRFGKITEIKDSIIFNKHIFIFPEYNLTVGYGKDWLLICDRQSFKKRFDRVVHARIKSIYPRWRKFIEERLFQERPLQVNVASKELRKYGITSAFFATSADSSSVTLHTRLTNMDTIPFSLKPNEERFERSEFTRRMINLNLNTDRLKNEKNHPLYGVLDKVARRISFPLDEFLDTWNGDVDFRQGGLQTLIEPYVESELDENFNVTEVVKYKQVKISGFSLRMSMNENRPDFINHLYSKGILTQEENKVRLLYFPPMNMQTQEESVNFYTGSFRPETIPDSTQSILWDFNYTPVLFTLDSIQSKIAYGKINIGLSKIVSDKIKTE